MKRISDEEIKVAWGDYGKGVVGEILELHLVFIRAVAQAQLESDKKVVREIKKAIESKWHTYGGYTMTIDWDTWQDFWQKYEEE